MRGAYMLGQLNKMVGCFVSKCSFDTRRDENLGNRDHGPVEIDL